MYSYYVFIDSNTLMKPSDCQFFEQWTFYMHLFMRSIEFILGAFLILSLLFTLKGKRSGGSSCESIWKTSPPPFAV